MPDLINLFVAQARILFEEGLEPRIGLAESCRNSGRHQQDHASIKSCSAHKTYSLPVRFEALRIVRIVVHFSLEALRQRPPDSWLTGSRC